MFLSYFFFHRKAPHFCYGSYIYQLYQTSFFVAREVAALGLCLGPKPMRCKKGRTKTLRRCLKAAAVRKAEQIILSRRNAEERVYPIATVPLASSCGGTGGASTLKSVRGGTASVSACPSSVWRPRLSLLTLPSSPEARRKARLRTCHQQKLVAKTTLLVFLLTCYVITLEVLAQFFLLCILVTRCHTVL